MTFYEKVPTDLLAQFYYEIQKNIENGILSQAMYQEVTLIRIEAEKRGVSLLQLKQYAHSNSSHRIQ